MSNLTALPQITTIHANAPRHEILDADTAQTALDAADGLYTLDEVTDDDARILRAFAEGETVDTNTLADAIDRTEAPIGDLHLYALSA
jgi:hypothetical protein